MKTRLHLMDDSIDTLAKMLIGYVLNMPKEEPNYQKKVEVVVEFLEEVLDPSFDSVACYLMVLELMPEQLKRRMPFRIEEFIRMYYTHIEKSLGRQIQAKYRPKPVIMEEKKIILPNGSELKIAENIPEEDKLKGVTTDHVILQ